MKLYLKGDYTKKIPYGYLELAGKMWFPEDEQVSYSNAGNNDALQEVFSLFQKKIQINPIPQLESKMLKRIRNYYKNKPTQAVLMLVVLIWSVYEIGATSLASNSALTKEFMHSRYVMVWPMVDKKVKLYHYAEEWTNDVLVGIMHLDYGNIKITSFPKKWESEAEVYYTLSQDEYADRVYFFLDEPISKAYISRLEQNYYLISNNAVAIKEETGKTVEQLGQEVGNARKNFLSALGKMKILRLVYLILRMIVLLQCIKWSGQRRKRKENEILQNGQSSQNAGRL